jgi:hypothetical protein
MDFSRVGFKAVWQENEEKAKKDKDAALVYLGFFAWFSVNLLASIIRTIGTNPGNIPEDREWDMDVAMEKEKKEKTDLDQEQQKDQKLTSEKFEKGKRDP